VILFLAAILNFVKLCKLLFSVHVSQSEEMPGFRAYGRHQYGISALETQTLFLAGASAAEDAGSRKKYAAAFRRLPMLK
jgi:hypothetical protein